MNRRHFLTVFGPFLPAVAGGLTLHAQASRGAMGGAEAQVRKAERDRFDAMVKRDIAVVDKLLAPELVYTHGDGRVIDKAAFIADLKTGDFQYTSIEPGDLKVQIFGDTAVVTGGAGMKVVNKGAPAQIRIRYTNVQVRRNGGWQMVAWQATRLP